MSFVDGGNAETDFGGNSALSFVDISKDVQAYLQRSPYVQALVAAPLIGSDTAWVNGWIFDSNLQLRMENTQRCAIVVSYAGGWNVPFESNTAHFPAVVVDIWADPTRKEDNSPAVEDAKTKCFQIHSAVFRTLHIATKKGLDGDPIYFDRTRVVSSELLSEPELSRVQDGNGAFMLRARYGITTY